MRRDLTTSNRSRSGWDLFREMDQLFNQFQSGSLFDNYLPEAREESEITFRPAADIRENDRGYLMSFDLPGLTEKDVKVEVRDGTLTISGERKRDETTKKDGWTRTERSYGRFFRSFSLPAEVEASKIEAQVENGELQLFLPKTEAAKPVEVPIRVSGSSGESQVKGLMERFFGAKDAKKSEGEQTAKH